MWVRALLLISFLLSAGCQVSGPASPGPERVTISSDPLWLAKQRSLENRQKKQELIEEICLSKSETTASEYLKLNSYGRFTADTEEFTEALEHDAKDLAQDFDTLSRTQICPGLTRFVGGLALGYTSIEANIEPVLKYRVFPVIYIKSREIDIKRRKLLSGYVSAAKEALAKSIYEKQSALWRRWILTKEMAIQKGAVAIQAEDADYLLWLTRYLRVISFDLKGTTVLRHQDAVQHIASLASFIDPSHRVLKDAIVSNLLDVADILYPDTWMKSEVIKRSTR